MTFRCLHQFVGYLHILFIRMKKRRIRASETVPRDLPVDLQRFDHRLDVVSMTVRSHSGCLPRFIPSLLLLEANPISRLAIRGPKPGQ
jgi:hypothetical protein